MTSSYKGGMSALGAAVDGAAMMKEKSEAEKRQVNAVLYLERAKSRDGLGRFGCEMVPSLCQAVMYELF